MFHRSPETKKRKVPDNQADANNGPSAKKAKTKKESSDSSESEEEKAPAKVNIQITKKF